MNLKRKIEMQERSILSLQKRIEKLTKENEALRSENQELLDRESKYQVQLKLVEETQREFMDGIIELNVVKEQYQQAVYEAQQMKKKFSKQFQPLIKQFKTQLNK